jgi:hypothetical protein
MAVINKVIKPVSKVSYFSYFHEEMKNLARQMAFWPITFWQMTFWPMTFYPMPFWPMASFGQ